MKPIIGRAVGLLILPCVLLTAGCTTQSWSYLFTQKPTPAQAHELISVISHHLTEDLGFSLRQKKSSGMLVYERTYDRIGLVTVDLKEGEYPLIYLTIPKSGEETPEIRKLFHAIEASYVAVGLKPPENGPGREVWFPLQ